MKKIVIATAKDGIGNTTTAVKLSASLAADGKNILLIDMEPQLKSHLSNLHLIEEPGM